jgi:hypothetical protein
MYLNPTQLPQHLRQDYNNVANAYKKLLDDVQEYQTSLLPRYVSIPKFFEKLGLTASYQNMLKLGKMASERAGIGQIKVGDTHIGQLRCFREELLDECFDEMTDGEDE